MNEQMQKLIEHRDKLNSLIGTSMRRPEHWFFVLRDLIDQLTPSKGADDLTLADKIDLLWTEHERGIKRRVAEIAPIVEEVFGPTAEPEPVEADIPITAGSDQPWSVRSCLEKLVSAADILLNDKNYDGDGWEQIQAAMNAAFRYLAAEPPAQAMGATEGTCKQSLQVGELPDQAVGATEPDFACDVCGNTPGEDGWLHHGKGCYVVGEDGGGDEYIQEADKHREQGDLLPCPFCGGKAEIDTDGRMHFAACRICCAEGPSGIVSQATSLWNRRTTSAERELAELKQAIENGGEVPEKVEGEDWMSRELRYWKAIQELQKWLAYWKGNAEKYREYSTSAQAENASLRQQVEELKAEVLNLRPLQCAVAQCSSSDVPESVRKAWQDSDGYRADELTRLREALEECEAERRRVYRECKRLTNELSKKQGALITARRKLRDDNGPSVVLGEPEQFVLVHGRYYPVEWIVGGQGLLEGELEVQQ